MNITLAWAIATWVMSSILGGLIAAWAAGRWQARMEARIAEEAATRKAEIKNEQEGRRRLHVALEAVDRRLAAGDVKFETQIVALTHQAARLEATSSQLSAFGKVLDEFPTKELCEQRHAEIERRLEIVEARRRRDAAHA